MSDEDGVRPSDQDDIDPTTVDAVTEPILDELERTAQNLTAPRTAGERSQRPGLAPTRRPKEAATGAVDFGLRMVERAALMPRRMVDNMLGIDTGARAAPPPTRQAPPAPSASQGPAASASRGRAGDAGPAPRAPARSVRSPLGGRPEMLTGARRPGVRGLPGRRAQLMVTVHNGSGTTVSARFSSTDLYSQSGGSIPASAVTFDPPALRIRARSSADVAISVHIPFGQSPGRYSGLVQAGETVRTIVDLEVG